MRLIDQEKVDIINGVYASAHAVPLAAKVEQQKKILWITTAVSTAVFKDKNLQYVFRAQIHSDQYGQAFASFIAEHAKAKLGMEPKDVKVALIHEDGPYGVGVAAADEAYSKEAGLQVVLREGYSASAPDLSVLVTKLKRARRRRDLARGLQSRHHPVPAPGARERPSLQDAVRQRRRATASSTSCARRSARTSTISATSIRCPRNCSIPRNSRPGSAISSRPWSRATRQKTGATDVPPHCSMGFNQTWVLLNNVLPVAKEKYGGFDPEAVRKAALDVDIPPGGTIQGYGVKFYPPGTPLSGQNERSTPVVMQNAGEHISVVWPTNIRTQDPVFPLPKSSIYAA